LFTASYKENSIQVLANLLNRIRSEHPVIKSKNQMGWNRHPQADQGGF